MIRKLSFVNLPDGLESKSLKNKLESYFEKDTEGKPRVCSPRVGKFRIKFSIRKTLNIFKYQESTEEIHKNTDVNAFFGPYANIRKRLDYQYHGNYTESRQRLQNNIVKGFLDTVKITDVNGKVCTTPTEPWIVFTAGAMGAGKGYTIEKLVEKGVFPLLAFVPVDPDEIRRKLPEFSMYAKKCPLQLGELTRKEAGLVSEILTLAALQKGNNVLVDGSLRDSKWYLNYFAQLRKEFPTLKIAILHVVAPRKAIIKRAEERGKKTRRMIPKEVLYKAIEEVPQSVKILGPVADYFCELNNAPGQEIEILTPGETWESFQSKWLQVCAWVPGQNRCILKKMQESYILHRQNSLTFMNAFDVNQSTEASYSIENPSEYENTFFGSYIHIRKILDYEYHKHYIKERQWLQDSIIDDFMRNNRFLPASKKSDPPHRPWIVFTAGAIGCGKQYTLEYLIGNNIFLLDEFVYCNPGDISDTLPESPIFKCENPMSFDEFTKKEAGYISEILALAAVESGAHVIVDGTLRDHQWHLQQFKKIREEFPFYRIGILHVCAPIEDIVARIDALHNKSSEQTKITLQNIRESCRILRPYTDYFCELYNPNDGEVSIMTKGQNWDTFKLMWQSHLDQ